MYAALPCQHAACCLLPTDRQSVLHTQRAARCLQFYFKKYTGHTIWLSNLFLKMDRSSAAGATLLYWEPSGANQLWLTDMTFECDGKAGGRGMYVQNGDSVFAQGAHPFSDSS